MNTRNLALLALNQTLFWCMLIVGITFSGLIGLQLAPLPALATLPMAIMALGGILTTVPLSLFMQRFGRRPGFMLGATMSISGALICMWAVMIQHFWLFSVGNLILGIAQSAAMYYRLAATDGVAPKQQGRAIAWVMVGSIVAALIAPSLSVWAKDLMLPHLYAGSYAAVAVIGTLKFFACAALANQSQGKADTQSGRKLSAIIKQPQFITALCNIVCSQGVMIFMMVSTPLAMVACGFEVSQTASVIQWHVLGMFIPSFFSGRLIDKFGSTRISVIGAGILLLSTMVSLSGIALANFFIGTFLLGTGWNLMYTAGTKMLTSSHDNHERGKVQGAAELAVSVVGAGCALGSGVLLHVLGWETMNAAAIPVLLLAAAITLWHSTHGTQNA